MLQGRQSGLRWTPLPHQSGSAWPALTNSLLRSPLPSTMSKPVAKQISCELESAKFVCHSTIQQCISVVIATSAHTSCTLHPTASPAHVSLPVVSSTSWQDCTVSCQALVLNFRVLMRHNFFAMQPIPLNSYLMRSPATALSVSVPLCKTCCDPSICSISGVSLHVFKMQALLLLCIMPPLHLQAPHELACLHVQQMTYLIGHA